MPSATVRAGDAETARPQARAAQMRAASKFGSAILNDPGLIYTHMTDIVACVAVPVSRGALRPAPGRKQRVPAACGTLHLTGRWTMTAGALTSGTGYWPGRWP